MDSTSNRVLADNDLQIEFDLNSWQLISTELETPVRLLLATSEGLKIHSAFAEARELSGATMTPAQIARVVLGWAPENQAWRLGLLLMDSDLTKYDTLSMHWCELASWHAGTQEAIYKQVGQNLARLLQRPFQFVDSSSQSRVPIFSRRPTPTPMPRLEDERAVPDVTVNQTYSLENTPIEDTPTSEDEAGIAEVEYPIIPLATLPLKIGARRLSLVADGVQWEYQSRWWVNHLGRIAVYTFVIALFLVLSIGTQRSGFAAVEPTWLPNAGLAVALFMLANLLYNLWQIVSASTVVVDTFNKQVYERGVFLPIIKWRVNFSEIDYVVLSQSPARAQGRPKHTAPMNIALEAWIHIGVTGGKFYQVADLETVEGRSWVWENVRRHTHHAIRRPVYLAEYDTPAHHAALHIAERLKLPLYLDLVQ